MLVARSVDSGSPVVAQFRWAIFLVACIFFSAQVAAQEQSRTLLVGTERGFYPFADIDDDGTPVGFTVDLFEATATKMNIDFEYRLGTWDEILQAIENKEIDVLPFVKHTERRDSFLDFSITHVFEHAIIIKRNDGLTPERVEDLAGKEIAVMKSDGPHIYLDAFVPDAQLVVKASTGEALQHLADGQHDYAMVARTVGLVQIRNLDLQDRLQRTGPLVEVYDKGFSFGVQQGNQKLLAILNEGLNLVKESGEYNDIYDRWFGDLDPKASSEARQRRVVYAFAGATTLALLIGTWLYMQRRLTQQLARDTRLISEANEATRQANLALQRQNERLAAYDHTIAHSLKTPLAATGRFLEILSKYKSEALSDEQQHLAQQALTTLKMGADSVDALLMLSTVAATEVSRSPLDMAELIQQALQQLTEEQEHAKAAIFVQKEWPAVLGYAPWIGEVWVIYLSNALRYSGEHARLELGSTPDDNGQVRFWVRDGGTPLTDEDREQLFEPFVRLHPEDGPGHGLGLTIVKRVVEKLEGKCGVVALEGRGNEFFFTLPKTDATPTSDSEALTTA